MNNSDSIWPPAPVFAGLRMAVVEQAHDYLDDGISTWVQVKQLMLILAKKPTSWWLAGRW